MHATFIETKIFFLCQKNAHRKIEVVPLPLRASQWLDITHTDRHRKNPRYSILHSLRRQLMRREFLMVMGSSPVQSVWSMPTAIKLHSQQWCNFTMVTSDHAYSIWNQTPLLLFLKTQINPLVHKYSILELYHGNKRIDILILYADLAAPRLTSQKWRGHPSSSCP